MTHTKQKSAARAFAEYWKDKGYEKGESQAFWLSLLREVFGIQEPEKIIRFEDQVKLDKSTGFIDGYIAETVCLLSKLDAKQHIEIDLHMDELNVTNAEKKATYQEIKDYVMESTGLHVSFLYIAQIKQKCGIIECESYNKPKSENTRGPKCPPDKEKAIREALRHFGMI